MPSRIVAATLCSTVTSYTRHLLSRRWEAEPASAVSKTAGGQTISLSTIERWQTRSGAPLIELWGMTDTGHVFVVDRRKERINSGEYNVYPAEIERVISAHPAVAMVAAGPLPDPVKGEIACAYVVDDLPKTSTGKVLRRGLIKLYSP